MFRKFGNEKKNHKENELKVGHMKYLVYLQVARSDRALI